MKATEQYFHGTIYYENHENSDPENSTSDPENSDLRPRKHGPWKCLPGNLRPPIFLKKI